MGKKRDLGGRKEEGKKFSFYRIFQQGTDLSSDYMRAIPYNFMTRLSPNDFSYKVVIKARWGSSWELLISKNPRFHYIEKLGWDKFVSDNALGENEFITFTHNGKMRFSVNIYEQNCKEILVPRKPPTMDPSSGVKKEQGESSGGKAVKKEVETSESFGGHELGVRKNIAEELKTSKKKKVMSKTEVSKTTKRKEIESTTVKNGVPEFNVTITKSYLIYLAIPKRFAKEYIPNESTKFTIRHPNGTNSWEVLSLVRDIRTIFSGGWSLLAREYPLRVGDTCTFKLVKPGEFLLVIS